MLYYIDKKTSASTSGEHKVHKKDCSKLPRKDNLILLGDYTEYKYTMKEAHKYYLKINACEHCCSDNLIK